MIFASIDCGTSNTRVYILDAQGHVLGRGERAVGVRDTSITGGTDALRAGVAAAYEAAVAAAHLADEPVSFAMANGMITSEIGLYEVDRLTAPAGLAELASGLVRVRDPKIFPMDVPVYLVPGVVNPCGGKNASLYNVGNLDFMRGEEAQAIGLLRQAGRTPPLILLILSSHTKFIPLNREGKISGSLTTLSGQAYQALGEQTFIGKSIRDDGTPAPENYFDPEIADVAYHWAGRSGFLRGLLMVRFLDVLLDTAWYQRRLFFEALIASEDLEALGELDAQKNEKIIIFGNAARCALYRYLLRSKAGWEGEIETVSDPGGIDQLNIGGMAAIARAAGLL